eukprot:tig00000310_g23929.t1
MQGGWKTQKAVPRPGEPPPRSFRFGGSLAPAADLRKLDGARAGALRRIPQVPRLAAAPSATRADVRGDLRTLLDLVLKPAHRFGGSASRGLRASRIASVELRFSAGRRQLRGEPLDSKPRTFPARPDVVRANVARAAGDGLLPLTRFIITHCVVDPTTFLVGSETEGWMTSVAGIVEYIARTEGPDTSAAVGADIENGRLDETLAGFGSWCRPYSYKLGGVWQTYIRGIVPKAPLSLGESQPALEAIAIPVAQFKDPAPDVGPFLVKPHTKGKGKRTRNSAPAFLPPQPPPRPPAAPRPAAHRRDAAAPGPAPRTPRLPSRTPLPRPLLIQGQGTRRTAARARAATGARPPRERRRPQPPPGPGAVLTAIQGFGAQQEAERRALAARQAREAEERRQALWAQRLQATIAFRAELDSGFRAGQIAGAEASERWRAFEAESAGLAKGLGYSYRRVPVLKDYASAAAREASRAEIDAAEEQAAREEAEDNARFRHLHH